MSTIRKENSMKLRFAKGTKTLPQLTHMYRPELHRQATERVPVSRLGQELTQLCQRGLGEAFDAGAMSQAKLELADLMDQVALSLKRNKMGLEVLPCVMLHCFAHWHVVPETTVVCLLPVAFHKAKVVQKDIGHVLIKMPVTAGSQANSKDLHSSGHSNSNSNSNSSTSRSSKAPSHDPQLPDVRTKDGRYVSPRKLQALWAKLVLSTLLKHGVDEERVEQEGPDHSVVVALDCGWRAELVPCVAVTGPGTDVEAGVYYVSRRFHGESNERGDNSWRPCFCAREQDLLRSIASTDDGLRLKAVYALCRMVSRDWRLEHFTCYDIQTVLLHDMDFHVDYSPRWQRDTLESCVRSMLKTLQYFVDREALPHFDMNQLNLWEGLTQRQMALARGALSRLLSNENALISLVRRACNGRMSCTHSVDFGLLGIG